MAVLGRGLDMQGKGEVRAKLERTPSCTSESSKPVMVFQDERLGQRWCRAIGIIVNLKLKPSPDLKAFSYYITPELKLEMLGSTASNRNK